VRNCFKLYITIFLSILSILPTCLLANETQQPLAREVLVQKHDTTYKYTYYFDDNKNQVVEDVSMILNDVSQAISRTEWMYQNNQVVLQREMKREQGSWQTVSLLETEYQGNNKSKETYKTVQSGIETIVKTIDYTYAHGKISSFTSIDDNQNTEKTVYTYDANGRIQSSTILNGKQSLLDSIQTIEYKYNQLGLNDSVLYYHYVNKVRAIDMLTIYYFDRHSNAIVKQTQKQWNPVAEHWDNLTQVQFTYHINSMLAQENYYFHNGSFWEPNLQYTYAYDEEGFLTEKIMYSPIYNQWRKISNITYTDKYNGQPNLMESTYNFWGGETGAMAENCIPYYFNGSITLMQANRIEVKYVIDTSVITGAHVDYEMLNVYPNPSNGLFYINPERHRITHWKVYNLSGVLVESNFNEFYTGIVDLTNLPDGSYMILASTDNQMELRQKLIINRAR